jgi:hypothetical protein
LREELPHIVLYRPDWSGTAHVNSFIVTGANNVAAQSRAASQMDCRRVVIQALLRAFSLS